MLWQELKVSLELELCRLAVQILEEVDTNKTMELLEGIWARCIQLPLLTTFKSTRPPFADILKLRALAVLEIVAILLMEDTNSEESLT
jgi:hypothetical protein